MRIGRGAGRTLALLGVALVVAAADTPTGPLQNPIDTILGLTPSGIVAFMLYQFISGAAVSGKLHDRAEARATEATSAAALSNKTAADAIAALATANKTAGEAVDAVKELRAEHEQERREWQSELGGLQREIARLAARPG